MQDGIRFVTTADELTASYQLRYAIYVESMGRLKDKGDHELKELRDEHDEYARAIVAITKGEPVGTLRMFWGGDQRFSDTLIKAYHLSPFLDIVNPEQICIVERLMVCQSHRGSSVTLRMYKEVMHFVLHNGIEAVLLDCEPHHLNSYLKLGFRPFTTPYTYPGIGLVIPMVLITGDYEHLKRVGSPFALLTSEDDLEHCCHVEKLRCVLNEKQNIISQTIDSKATIIDVINSARDGNTVSFDNKLSVLNTLDESEISRLIEKSHIIHCELGDHIIEKNNSAKTMFILLSGYAEVKRENQLIAIISPGEVVGEIAFFLDVPRSASIIAASEGVSILSLDETSMARLFKKDSQLSIKILMNLCRGLCSRIVNGVETEDIRSIEEEKKPTLASVK